LPGAHLVPGELFSEARQDAKAAAEFKMYLASKRREERQEAMEWLKSYEQSRASAEER
jgi:hypothetical protein